MPHLTLESAQSIAQQAVSRAASEHGKPICVAVCDERGALLAFARADGAPVRSIRISQGKAYTAARMGGTTQALLERLHREQIEVGYFCDPELTALPGGSPIKAADGTLIGAVGVSGLTSAQDQAITDAVAAAAAAG